MSFSVTAADERVAEVSVDQDSLSVRLKDGRTITVPLAWYPRLFHATPEQRLDWKVAGGGYGIHWPSIDEDISTERLLRGAPAPPTQVKRSAWSQSGTCDGRGHPPPPTPINSLFSEG